MEPYHIHNPIPLTHPLPPPAFAPQPPQQSIPEPEPIPISSPSPPPQSRAQNPKVEFAIWSRRPQDPSQAPGVVISVYARPSQDIFQQALDLPTPPMSPIFLAEEMEPGLSPSSTETKPEQDNVQPEPESTAAPITEPEQALVPEVDAETERASETDAIASSTVPSSCVTEATDLGTRAPVSPATSATSLSASIENIDATHSKYIKDMDHSDYLDNQSGSEGQKAKDTDRKDCIRNETSSLRFGAGRVEAFEPLYPDPMYKSSSKTCSSTQYFRNSIPRQPQAVGEKSGAWLGQND
ncbi:hypothetical protein H0H93_011346 [Arthromyces matolae]|nr:hypothetical protein H0H93_011346 [Arthromyces matolae]